MTQENRELLLNVLCTMLPHGVMFDIGLNHPLQLKRILVDRLDGVLLDFYEDGNDYQVYLSEVKPYLRPMGSMISAEVLEYLSLKEDIVADDGITYSFETYESIDWLNAHHFDYRGLIDKNLALDCTGLHIYD